MASSRSLFREHWECPYGKSNSQLLYSRAKASLDVVQRLKLETKLEVHNGCVNTICWNELGSWILSGSDDQRLCITDPFTQKSVTTIQSGHFANIFSAKFLPNTQDNQVVSCSGDGMIHYTIVDRPDQHGQHPFDCHFGTTYELVTVPQDCHTFLSCGEDGTVRWFDLRIKERCLKDECKEDILINCRRAVTALAINPLRPYQLSVGCSDSSVRIFDRRMLGTRATGNYTGRSSVTGMVSRFTAPLLEGHSHRITSLSYSTDGTEVLASFSSEQIYLFNLNEDGRKEFQTNKDESTAEVSNASSPRHPPIKRLRLRGDWSDTGPNARPERERGPSAQENNNGGSDEQGAGQQDDAVEPPAAPAGPQNEPRSVTIMQRMSDMLTRWLEGATRQTAEQGGTNEAGPSASEGQDEQPTEQGSAVYNSGSEAANVGNDAQNEENAENVDAGSAMASGSEGKNSAEDQGRECRASSEQASDDKKSVVTTSETAGPDDVPEISVPGVSSLKDESTKVASEDYSSDKILSGEPKPGGVTEEHKKLMLPLKEVVGNQEEKEDKKEQLGDLSEEVKAEKPETQCEKLLENEKPIKSESVIQNESQGGLDGPNLGETSSGTESQISSDQAPVDKNSSVRATGANQQSISRISNQTVEPLVSLRYTPEGTSSGTIRVDFPESGTEAGPNLPPGLSSFSGAVRASEKKSATKVTPCSSRSSSEESNSSGKNLNLANVSKETERASTSGNSEKDDKNVCSLADRSDTPIKSEGLPSAAENPKPSESRQVEGRDASPVEEEDGSNDESPANERPLDGFHVLKYSPSDDFSDEDSTAEYVAGSSAGQPHNSAEPPGGGSELPQRLASANQENEGGTTRTVVLGRGGRQRRHGRSGPPTGDFQLHSASDDDDSDDELARAAARRDRDDIERNLAALRLQELYRKRQDEREREEQQLLNIHQPALKHMYCGHRNARTMIKEATFWGEQFVMSGSDCGHIFIWDRFTSELVMVLEGDKHVVNCLQPHPFDPVLASSGIDYDIKIWMPTEETANFDSEKADEVVSRNRVMLEETRDTITVPASFMLRMLASLNHIRAGRRQGEANSSSSSSEEE